MEYTLPETKIQIDYSNIFQMGWFNHQLVKIDDSVGNGFASM